MRDHSNQVIPAGYRKGKMLHKTNVLTKHDQLKTKIPERWTLDIQILQLKLSVSKIKRVKI